MTHPDRFTAAITRSTGRAWHRRVGRLLTAGLGVVTLGLLLAWTVDMPVPDLNLILALTLVAVVVGATWGQR